MAMLGKGLGCQSNLLTGDGTSGNDGFSAKKSVLCFKIDPTKRGGYILVGHGLHWEYYETSKNITLVQVIMILHGPLK